MVTKSQLAIQLSKLKAFDNPKIMAEQYATDSEVAAELLWFAYMQGDIEGKTIADLGCGTGILGIGCLILGAKEVFFVDNDEKALDILKFNLNDFDFKNITIKKMNVENFNQKVSTVIQNPPFGTKEKHADKEFLLKAFQVADAIYSFHKSTSSEFISKLSADNHFKITNKLDFNFPLKQSMAHHRKRIQRIEVSCWRLEKE